ncbi:MazG nucleotide pyrophosphohydrolase domain-containing protein [Pseudomonas sp. HUK17]|uniref:MazG nucleotide pyrophosphohydrolase domain-containing protein n=1 Tax=Pseudomonas sp. HUK17 TaxID=1799359 RepID=UPI000791B7E0|nr:MazG nucleotide pyrophosphohydrolase domain-containing protein [Pseudomonas sp. HUK17]KXJ31081.1 hypothetical protein AX284_04335 [Pseudomonas sp. HUK17]
MEIKDLIELQAKLDDRHGFPSKFESQKEKYDQLSKDLVGLFGEIGEFSNVVKKINLKISYDDKYDLDLSTAKEHLSEELVDSLIYILRIARILGIDIQEETLKKMRANEKRYAKLRRY